MKNFMMGCSQYIHGQHQIKIGLEYVVPPARMSFWERLNWIIDIFDRRGGSHHVAK